MVFIHVKQLESLQMREEWFQKELGHKKWLKEKERDSKRLRWLRAQEEEGKERNAFSKYRFPVSIKILYYFYRVHGILHLHF